MLIVSLIIQLTTQKRKLYKEALFVKKLIILNFYGSTILMRKDENSRKELYSTLRILNCSRFNYLLFFFSNFYILFFQ